MPYQILLPPVCKYSIQGRPCGSRYQQHELNTMPTWRVGTVTPTNNGGILRNLHKLYKQIVRNRGNSLLTKHSK